MNLSTIYGKRIVALGGAMLLCGSMGFAQMRGSAGPTAQGQAPGQNPSTDPQMNGMQSGRTALAGGQDVRKQGDAGEFGGGAARAADAAEKQ